MKINDIVILLPNRYYNSPYNPNIDSEYNCYGTIIAGGGYFILVFWNTRYKNKYHTDDL